jgi:hypothetical protein
LSCSQGSTRLNLRICMQYTRSIHGPLLPVRTAADTSRPCRVHQ